MTRALVIIRLLALALFAGPVCSDPAWSGRWLPGFGSPRPLPGLDGAVQCLGAAGGEILAGGDFTWAGGTRLHGIGRWDGNRWWPMGGGKPAMFFEYSGILHAAGDFTDPGTAEHYAIAMWDGARWVPALQGLHGSPIANAILDGAVVLGGFDLSVDGSLPGEAVARWDGTSWSILGHLSGILNCLCVHDGRLLAGVIDAFPFPDPCHAVWSWDGTAWSALGSFPGDWVSVTSLLETGGDLLASGSFYAIGEQTAEVWRWNGSSWDPLGLGLRGSVRTLVAYRGDLVACGESESPADSTSYYLARRVGDTWQPMTAADAYVAELLVAGDRLYAGGGFASIGGIPAEGIASWDGTTWNALGEAAQPGQGLAGYPYGMASFENTLLVAGPFKAAGDVAASGLAQWDGARWLAVETPFGMEGRGFTFFEGSLVVSGSVRIPSGEYRTRIARRDGEAWTAMGPLILGSVRDFEVFDGSLLAGGSFWSEDGSLDESIMRWTGSEWAPFAHGSSSVMCLERLGDDLIAAGSFPVSEEENVQRVARWDGSAWPPLGGDFRLSNAGRFDRPILRAVTVYDGSLIAAGTFDRVGDAEATGIVRWDGTAWRPLGGGLSGSVWSLATYHGSLVAGGSFTVTGEDGGRLEGIARWNGEAWNAVGTGTSRVNAAWGPSCLAAHEGLLFAGGPFRDAGGEPSQGIACWDDELSPALIAAPGRPNPTSAGTVIEYTLPAAGRVHIAVYDVRGRQIAVLRDEFEDAGRYATSWNGRDSDGRRMASGTYFARIEAAGSSKTVKVVIAR